jgi:hypothetical protein
MPNPSLTTRPPHPRSSHCVRMAPMASSAGSVLHYVCEFAYAQAAQLAQNDIVSADVSWHPIRSGGGGSSLSDRLQRPTTSQRWGDQFRPKSARRQPVFRVLLPARKSGSFTSSMSTGSVVNTFAARRLRPSSQAQAHLAIKRRHRNCWPCGSGTAPASRSTSMFPRAGPTKRS